MSQSMYYYISNVSYIFYNSVPIINMYNIVNSYGSFKLQVNISFDLNLDKMKPCLINRLQIE